MKTEVSRELFDADEFQEQIESLDLMRELIKIFPEETSEYLGNARKAIDQNDPDELYVAALSLKGIVGNYLGTRAFAASDEVARLARKERMTEAREALIKCEDEIKSLEEALLQFQLEML